MISKINPLISLYQDSCTNKKILLMMIIASAGLPILMILSSLYPASEYSFTLGVGLAIFGVIIAIEIVLYSKVRKEIPE